MLRVDSTESPATAATTAASAECGRSWRWRLAFHRVRSGAMSSNSASEYREEGNHRVVEPFRDGKVSR